MATIVRRLTRIFKKSAVQRAATMRGSLLQAQVASNLGHPAEGISYQRLYRSAQRIGAEYHRAANGARQDVRSCVQFPIYPLQKALGDDHFLENSCNPKQANRL